MSLLRWIPTLLAFPLGGLVSMLLLGGVDDPLTAVVSGAIVGAAVGGAQWLALGRLVGRRWLALTVGAVAIGGLAAFLVVGAPVTTTAAVVTGLVTGLSVGVAQGIALGRGPGVAVIWSAVVALSWGLGWLITSFVIVDLDRGHAVFGSSGAAVVTILTGIALRAIVGPRRDRSGRAVVAVPQDGVHTA